MFLEAVEAVAIHPNTAQHLSIPTMVVTVRLAVANQGSSAEMVLPVALVAVFLALVTPEAMELQTRQAVVVEPEQPEQTQQQVRAVTAETARQTLLPVLP
jgi:antitoxin component of MazEF toxin-antitoxin module